MEIGLDPKNNVMKWLWRISVEMEIKLVAFHDAKQVNKTVGVYMTAE